MRLLLVITLICIGIANSSGCATTSAPEVLEPVASRFTGIPVPSNFKSLPQSTYSLESSSFGVRLGTVRYQGRATLDQVINFYKEQMPKQGWTLANSIEYGNVMLNFSRQNEVCLINLSGSGSSVTITISLGPKPLDLLKKLETNP